MFRLRVPVKFLIILTLCSFAFCKNASATYPDGTLVRPERGNVVFEIRNGRKFPVVDARKAASRAVIEISAAELAQIPDMPLNTQYSDAPPPAPPAYGYVPTVPGPPAVTVVPGGYAVTPVPVGVLPRTVNAPQSGFPAPAAPAMPNAPVTGLPPPPPPGIR